MTTANENYAYHFPGNPDRDEARHLIRIGGQHGATIGTSTKDIADAEDTAQRLADFEAEWERIRFGILAGREW